MQPIVRPVLRPDAAFLVAPSAGYPLPLDPQLAARLDAALQRMLDSGNSDAARLLAEDLLVSTPGLPPVAVLRAEVDVFGRDYAHAVAILRPVGEALPSYLACQLALGRAAEQSGDAPLAYGAFRSIATASALAGQRASELRAPALEALVRGLDDALRRGRLDDAERPLALLKTWAPQEDATLAATRSVAVARGDRTAELQVVRALRQRHPEDVALAERGADLESEVGDAATGMRLLEDLARRTPHDRALQRKLANARFRWRLQLLPGKVREVAQQPQLTRADLALVLYWLLPDVRYGRPSSAKIAADILDHRPRTRTSSSDLRLLSNS